MFDKYKSTISANQLVGISITCLESPLCHMNLAQLTAQITLAIEAVLVAGIGAWKKVNNKLFKGIISSKMNRRKLTFEQPRSDLRSATDLFNKFKNLI